MAGKGNGKGNGEYAKLAGLGSVLAELRWYTQREMAIPAEVTEHLTQAAEIAIGRRVTFDPDVTQPTDAYRKWMFSVSYEERARTSYYNGTEVPRH